MSMPTFPSDANIPTREEAINQILSSIAMEELGLSHILNAEGEKLQYILGTLEGITGPGATIDDVLDVNESVQEMLQTAAHNQMFLRRKMKDALNASVMQGPTGAMGPSGTAAAQPFVSGTSYLAGDLILYYDQVYVVNVESPTGTPGSSIDYTLLSASDEGITGPTGATGPGFNTYGSFVSFSSSTYAGGTPSTPVILPLAQATATVNPSSAFTLNLDGSITVNQAGTYSVTALVLSSNAAQFSILVNNEVSVVDYRNFGVTASTGGSSHLTTVLVVNAGDTVSLSLISPTVTLNNLIATNSAQSLALTLIRIA